MSIRRAVACSYRGSVSTTNICGTDNDFDRPSRRGLSASLPRHFVPGYDQPVPPGQTISLSFRDKSHSPIEAPDNYLSAYEVYPGLNYLGPSGCMMKIVSLPNKDPIPLFHFGS